MTSPAQLEYRLKMWNFRHNIPEDAWSYIDHRIVKRKQLEGKDSEVFISGVKLSSKEVRSKTRRNRPMSIVHKYHKRKLTDTARYRSRNMAIVLLVLAPSPRTPEGLPLSIKTPEGIPPTLSVVEPLPWRQFQIMLPECKISGPLARHRRH